MGFLVFGFWFFGDGLEVFFNEQPSQGLEPFEGKIFRLLSFEFMEFLVFGFWFFGDGLEVFF